MSTQTDFIDFHRIRPHDLPPAWQRPAQEQEALAAQREALWQLRIEKRIPDEFLLPDEVALQDALVAERWFILKNQWGFRSTRGRWATGRRETYFTAAGVPRPFNGLQRIYLFLSFELEMGEEVALGKLQECIALGLAEDITRERAHQYLIQIYQKTGKDLRKTRS